MAETVRQDHEQEVDDESLMRRYAAGDAAAFEELFARYERRAYVFFFRRTGSPQRAEDLYQELFLRIHKARDRYDPSRPFPPWFFRIAHRLLVDDYRRAFRRHETPLEAREPRAEQRDAEASFGDREQAARLLGALSPEERYVVLSAKVEGIGYPELAEQTGRSVDAVRKMASRATQRLRAAAQPASRATAR